MMTDSEKKKEKEETKKTNSGELFEPSWTTWHCTSCR